MRHRPAPARVRSAMGALAVTAALLAGCAVAGAPEPADDEAAFDRFAEQMAREHGLDADRVREVLAASERQQDIIDAMERPAEALPWHRYRGIFLKQARIQAGADFWDEHEALIRRVSEAYGVSPAVLVAIVGVETRYGTYTGRHRVIDALRTLAFDYPPRSGFFRGELADYFLLTREEGIDPLGPKGSYAGAMGMPQFIASSYRAYAVDFNDNGRRDLWDELPDVLGSVANYFARHGWRSGEPVAVPAEVDGDDWRPLADAGGLKPNTTVGELARRGVYPQETLPADAPARLTVLEGEDGPQYWVTLTNFYVITRYNHSPLYAMAVHQLGEAIREARGPGA
ncbi:Membrane-bound lytic murein transglycosylase B [wastewater metagenome]|uniref:Membrane-bound lytic murein transglycosylase B n=2 Tax=unclassified sequences TaxID=12908 RepID=A0A5B8R8V7_9ZZZZ|nr:MULTISPECIES: lytic murein transglycosylase B [Arhodomonas]MCS4505521.1 lytic murein transglycosylase B [Arhodomonas aquaeolei]QEA03894.1 membrane-bound lytic murein transglycosylase B [uncultured organism]